MFEELLQILNSTGIPFCAYRWDHRPAAPYGTAQIEGGADTVPGDGQIIQQGIRCSVDLYAPDSSTTYPAQVQTALNGVYAWRLNSVQYEETTRLVHYEWLVELEGL